MTPPSLLVRNFIIFCLLLLACVASLGLYSLQANKEIEAADIWVDHTQTVILETQQLITGLHQMLADQRGYLLTNNQNFVTRYEVAKQTVARQLKRVHALVKDNPPQLGKLTALNVLIEDFIRKLDETVPPAASAGEKFSAREAVSDLRDQIVVVSQELLREEYGLLKTRAASLEQKTKNYRNTLFIGGLTSALLLLFLNAFLLKAQESRTSVEKVLKETKDRLALAVRGSNNGVFDHDLVSGEMYWSPQYKSMLGYADHELTATSAAFESLVHPDDKDRVLNLYRQYINENLSEYADIFRMEHKSGRWVWIQARGMGLFDDSGRATRFVGTHTDISHLKDYERRLEEEKDRAEKANMAKSEFLAHMSHEIRTPLTAISGIAEILSNMEDSFDEKQKRLIHTLSSSATSLKDLIADILDFSRIESGEIELNEKHFPLENMFEQVVSIISIKAAEKQLDFTFDYHDLAGRNFYGDQARFRQILINLVGNAVKFTDKGYVRVKAREEIVDKISVLNITIEDSGIGIAPESQDIIFEKFRQADASVSRRYGGTGLGLPISRKLVELMHGMIKVESVPGKGSVFSVFLPFKDRNTVGDSSIQLKNINKEHDRLKNIVDDKQKILIVEDYEGNIVVLSHLLEEMGYGFDVAQTGLEALECWKNNDYSLILMDVQMPEMDGLTATHEIRTVERETGATPTPIIGLTAHALVADREKCIESGMDSYMAKPIDEAELHKMIKRYIKTQPGKKTRAA